MIQIENNQNFKLTKKILDRYKNLPYDSKILKNLNIIEEKEYIKIKTRDSKKFIHNAADAKIIKGLVASFCKKEDKHLSKSEFEKLTMEKLKESKVGDQFYKPLCYLTNMKLQGRNLSPEPRIHLPTYEKNLYIYKLSLSKIKN